MITLLDGGMGFELQLRGVKVPSHTESIWSALALVEDPEAVVDVHAAYIEAGADVLTINNYAVTPPILARLTNAPVGGYANAENVMPDGGHEGVDDDPESAQRSAATVLRPDAYADEVELWLKAGASIIGGCCGTRPKHIKRLKELLESGS